MRLHDLDARTITQAQNGDAAARHRILAYVAAWLPRAVAARYPDQGGRDDLCQEVILQIHLGLDRIKQPEHFEAWAYGVLRNCTYARYRSDRRDRAEPTERVEELEAVPGAVKRPPTPEDLSSRAEAWRLGMRALASLSPKLREVYALYLEEHTLSEIALMLDLPRGTVAYRLRTAQALVRRRLAHTTSSSTTPKVHRFPSRKGG